MHVSSMNRHVSSICAGGQYLFRQTRIEVIVFLLVDDEFPALAETGPPDHGHDPLHGHDHVSRRALPE
jgi:hypothetical protein